MNDGERQVAETIEGIRRDHRARYEWAAKKLKPGSRVVDVACGVGYGTRILAEAGHRSFGLDNNEDALSYARRHYSHKRASFAFADGNKPAELGDFDAAVCFETIEHIEEPRPLLVALRRSAPLLVASVPNEEKFPYLGYAFHFRHYTRGEFEQLLAATGWRVLEWHGQEGPESEVVGDMNGRTLIAVAERVLEPVEIPPPEAQTAGTDAPPQHVAIVGLGPSLTQYLEITKRLGGRSRYCNEVWALNALGNVLECDIVFHMDDVRIQEIRAAALPKSNVAAMLPWLKKHPGPVVTSRAHPDYPGLVEYPLEAVLNAFGFDYFNSTAAYAIAYAIYIGVKKISIFGMDFTYPDAHAAERGRACVEFWLGIAGARGIKISLPKTTSLMDAMHNRAARLYGYDAVEVAFNIQRDGSVKLGFTDRKTLPTAAEMEERYDHSEHPRDQVRKEGAT